MEFLECSKAKIGDIVVLVAPGSDYYIGPDNPVIGSSWFCSGVITRIDSVIHVKWESGNNSYRDFELARIEEFNVGICESIW